MHQYRLPNKVGFDQSGPAADHASPSANVEEHTCPAVDLSAPADHHTCPASEPSAPADHHSHPAAEPSASFAISSEGIATSSSIPAPPGQAATSTEVLRDSALFARIYQTVVDREATFDGIYYTGVTSTRIVCRPSCRAKTPLARNVRFFPSLEEACDAGFRPCKRCKPEANGTLRPDAQLAAQVDALLLKAFPQPLTLQQMAQALAVSPYHLQRTYKAVKGFPPAERIEQLRLTEACRLLQSSTLPIAAIAWAIGYRSASHFSAWFARHANCTPTAYREQAAHPAKEEKTDD